MLDLKLLKKIPKKQLALLSRMAKINLARRNFYYYCKALYPDIYNEDHAYLKDVCTKIQMFYENKIINKNTGKPYMILHLNMPPRFFKSFTISRFEEWMMGKDSSRQAINASYNAKLSIKFARGVRDGISADKGKNGTLTFADIFDVKIRKGHSSVSEWSLDNPKAHLSFLATSFNSSLTGFGTNGIFVIDDQINSAEDAKNETLLDEQYYWVCNTALSRIEGTAKLICVFTRWTSSDICGRMLEDEFLRDEILVIKYEAMDLRTGKLLCPAIMDLRKYNLQKKMMDPAIFAANYHQTPINNEGRLYKSLRQYKRDDIRGKLSALNSDIRVVIDPTDGKNDFFCGISYLVDDGCAYVLDVFHKNKAENITPKKLAAWVATTGAKKFWGETNKNRQFILDIHSILKEDFNRPEMELVEVYSTDNKETRIEMAAWWVRQFVFFPENWNIQWKEFYNHIYNYQAQVRNQKDDAPDAVTMIKDNVFNTKIATKQVNAFTIAYKRKPTLEEEYFYGN